LSNNYIPGIGTGEGNNSLGPRRDREGRSLSANGYANNTGALQPLNAGRAHTRSFDFEEMIISLRELFVSDRQTASQAENRRCGLCYLYYVPSELSYREEEGFYICMHCNHGMGKQDLPMLRRQQK
jgi:hypothetical protein